MVSILIFCHKKKEADILHKLCGCCAALTGDEAQVTDLYGSSLGAQMEKGTGRVWDLLIFEMSSSEDISEAVSGISLHDYHRTGDIAGMVCDTGIVPDTAAAEASGQTQGNGSNTANDGILL